MKQGKPIITAALDTLCFVFECNVSDSITYVNEEEKEE